MTVNKTYAMLILLAAIIVSLAIPPEGRARSAPNFKLRDLDGNEFELHAALEKGPVLLDFWATWCQPCIRALPRIRDIKNDFADRGLSVFTVNEDGPRNLTKIRPFLKTHDLDFSVLLDLNSSVMNAFRINSIPTTVLIDESGEIVYFHRGYKPGDEQELRMEIEKLLQ